MRGAESRDFFGLNAPAQIHAAAEHAGVGTRRVYEDAVKGYWAVTPGADAGVSPTVGTYICSPSTRNRARFTCVWSATVRESAGGRDRVDDPIALPHTVEARPLDRAEDVHELQRPRPRLHPAPRMPRPSTCDLQRRPVVAPCRHEHDARQAPGRRPLRCPRAHERDGVRGRLPPRRLRGGRGRSRRPRVR